MLTQRGWAALGASAALGLLWLGLGELELLTAALLLTGGTGLSALMVRLLRPRVEVVRRLAPTLVHEGDHAIVEATVFNRGRWPLPNPVVEDKVIGLGSARFAASSIGSGDAARATYQILCRPRGVYQVGPASVTVSDPLHLTTEGGDTGLSDRLIVYPSVEDLEGFPITRGRDPSHQAARPEFSHMGGEDFFTLRDYRHGDDLRHVHWPSSAKRDQLMIRQLETPWQSQALVLFDPRSGRYQTPAAFEKAVQGAASLLRHLYRSGYDADFSTGLTSILASEGRQYQRGMEALAVVEPHDRLDIRAACARLQRTGRGGALIIVTGTPDDDLLSAQRMLSTDYPSTILLSVIDDGSKQAISATGLDGFQHAGAVTVTITPEESWAPAWVAATNRSWATASPG